MIHLGDTTTNKLCDEEIIASNTVYTGAICHDYNYLQIGYSSNLSTARPLYTQEQDFVPVNSWMVCSQTDFINKYIEKIKRRTSKKTESTLVRLINSEISTISNSFYKFIEISQEIREMSENQYFNKVLTNALSEISFLLDKEEINYQISVKIEEDLEIPEWKETLISIKIPKINPKELIQLWGMVEKRVRNKIESIKDENEAIIKINENLAIVMDVLE